MKTIINNQLFNAFLLLLLLSLRLGAQTENAQGPKNLYGGFGHLNFSGEQLNLGDLNTSLSANGYGKISPYTGSFGGGGAFVIHNFVIGGGGAWLMNTSTQNGTNTFNIKGGYGHFNFGYVAYTGKRSLLYPTLGIGGGGYNILISQKNPKEDFPQQLNTPQGTMNLGAGGWMATVQLSYQYFFNKNTTEGFCIGIKAGYKYSPYNWRTTMLNNSSIGNSPSMNMNGVYITLFLGGGSVLSY